MGVCVVEMLNTGTDDLDYVRKYHEELAKEKQYDESPFVVVDNNWDSQSVLILGVEGKQDGVRARSDTVVELLQWVYLRVYVGLIFKETLGLEDLMKKIEEAGLLESRGEGVD